MLYCILGSILCNPIEPIWEALGFLRFHPGNDLAFTMFHVQGTPVSYPWWAMFVYVLFSGVACYTFYRMYDSRPTRRTFWYCVAGQAVFNILLEGFIITSAYDYYGDHPWRWGSDFPLWWVFANFGEILSAAILIVAVRYWGKRAMALAIIVVPSSFAAWELWAGWPVYATLNMDVSMTVRNLSALLTAVIALATLWAIERIMLSRKVTELRPADEAEEPVAATR